MACLRTEHGVVAMRWGKSREKQSITVRDSKAQPKAITGGWLRSSDRNHRPGWQSPEELALYQKALKQACLLAARQMDLRDLDDMQKAQVVAREKGYPQSVEGVRRLKDEARKKVQDMEHGKEPVPLPPQNLRAEAERLRRREEPKKNKVYKKGQKTGLDRQAWFLIEGGKLKIYPSDRKGCKPKTVYELSGIHCTLQDERTFRRTDASAPKGFTERLQVTIPDRKHGPLFLYSTGNQAASRRDSGDGGGHDDPNFCQVAKVGNILLVRGWTSLFRYHRELDTLRRLVYRFQGKVTMMELSKGMTKFKLAYKKRRQDEELKEQQQQWAAQLLADKLQRVKAVTTLRDPRGVRHDVVSSVQSRFRVYRQTKMADREYPLGTSVQSRVQQALTGKVVGAAFKSLKSVEALTLILNKETERQIRGVESQMKGKLKTYSEEGRRVSMPAGQVSINVSDNFGMLSFVDTDSEMEHSHLNNAGWAHYVNIDEISSVILHSERKMALRNKKYELSASMSKGTWVTINGPRICWCRHVRMDAEGRKEVVGAANPFGVPMALAQGAKVRWFRVSVVVKSASVVAEGGANAEEPEADEELETYMVLHFLGRRFQSEVQAGESPRYFVLPVPQAASGGAQTLEVEVPISDEGGLAALDDSEVGMDIVAWNHDPALRRTIWAGKLPLWKAPPDHGLPTGPHKPVGSKLRSEPVERGERFLQRSKPMPPRIIVWQNEPPA
ncbi:unnamed protein product [Prorocentrum cordatum]|uniref:Uncharacterized protein n=1 Tax=Prorocentrum cordatum TaxID=2364126 RepID=A0ABN9YGC3_9DINO|nr:unnamed protein product [Polarella glacialis]